MKHSDHAQSRLWVRSENSLGNHVPSDLIEAAQRIWDRARLVVVRYLADDSEAAEILERAVDAASRAHGSSCGINHADAYLLKSVAREAIRRKRKRPPLVSIPDGNLDQLASSSFVDHDRHLDNHKLMMLLRASLDSKGREMLEYRLLEFEWSAIAAALGYSNGHSAEVQFRRKLDQALSRMELHHGIKVDRLMKRGTHA